MFGLQHSIEDKLESTWHSNNMINQNYFVHILKQAIITPKTKTQKYKTAPKYNNPPLFIHLKQNNEEVHYAHS